MEAIAIIEELRNETHELDGLAEANMEWALWLEREGNAIDAEMFLDLAIYQDHAANEKRRALARMTDGIRG